MADTIGRVEYVAGIDGKRLPFDARRAAREAGDAFNREFNKSFDGFEKELSRRFTATNRRLFSSLGRDAQRWLRPVSEVIKGKMANEFNELAELVGNVFYDRESTQKYLEGLDDLDEGSKRLRNSLDRLRATNQLTDEQYKSYTLSLNHAVGKTREKIAANKTLATQVRRQNVLWAALSSRVRQFATNLHQSNKESGGLFKRWRSMPHGFRQFTFYMALFTALAPEIAVLGSAAGSGITVLAGAAAAGAAGVGVFIAAVKGLGDDLADLPAAVHPAAIAFQSFKESLGGLQDTIQAAATSGLASGFNSLRSMVEGLMPTFEAFGGVVGDVFARFGASLEPGTKGFELLKNFLEESMPIFSDLADAGMSFGSALGGMFETMAPTIQSFSGWLADIGEQFSNWTNSEPGRKAIQEWMETAAVLWPALAELAGSLGKTLSDLVTPELVASFATFIGQLADFLPYVGDLLGVVADMGLFAILGAIFEALTPTIAVLTPIMSELVSTLSGGLVQVLGLLGPLLGKVAVAFIPVLETIMPLIPIVTELAGKLLGALGPAIVQIMGVFVKLLAPIVDIVTVLLQYLMPIITPLISLLAQLIEPVLTPLIYSFQALAFVLDLLAPLFQSIGLVVGAVIQTIVALFTGDLQSIGQIWEDLWNKLLEILLPWIEGIIGMFTDFWNNTMGMFNDFFGMVGEAWSNFWNGIAEFFQSVWDRMVAFYTPIIQGIQATIASVVGAISATWNAVWSGISSFFTGIWNGITNFVGGAIRGVQNIINSVTGAIGRAWDNFWGGLSNVVSSVWNGIKGTVEGGINGVLDVINGLIDGANAVAGALNLPQLPKIPKVRFAEGGTVLHRMEAIVGESGPEAIVPLNRPLHQVDPSVRALSAIAQGLAVPASGGGTVIEQGAIQVITPASNPVLVANQVLDRIAVSVSG